MIAEMVLLGDIVQYTFFAVTVVIAYQLATGHISMVGLLSSSPQSTADPERVLMLCITLAGVFYYIALATGAVSGESVNPTSLPEAPEWLTSAVGASNLFYLTGKSMR